MAKTGFRWVKPPEELARAFEAYGERVMTAVRAAAAYEGQAMQDDARRSAPWEDRTGNARSGLFYAVDGFGMPPIVGSVSTGASGSQGEASITESGDGTHLILVLGHTVFYGKYLETSNGGKYAVVMSTIENHLPALERMLAEVVKGGGLMARAGGFVNVV